MHNLKEAKGTYKGLIGECMFKLTRKYAVINKYWNKRKYFEVFGKHLTQLQIQFINRHWYSLDALEISFNPKKVTLYEIKTRNIYSTELGFKPKITESTVVIYEKGIAAGLNVKIALVELHSDWNYKVNVVDFNEDNYCIDKPKKYDAIFSEKR